jgi:D-arabinose 5-phosphate isomerase GutQ
MKNSSWEQAKEAFVIESRAIVSQLEKIDKGAFSQAVNAIKKSKRIGTTGCGHSGIACMHFAHLLCCIEKPARFISPAEAIHGGMGFIQQGDTLLWVSRGGKTAELIPILNIARKKGASIIGVTGNPDSPLAQNSDILLLMSVERETDKFNSQGTSSFCVTNAIFDALQTALIEETGYRNEQFAVIHPGGAVGERLNKKKNKPM